MSLPEWPALLDESRTGKIAQLLLVAYPDLPRESEFLTFIVPAQVNVPRDRVSGSPHEPGCTHAIDGNCECPPMDIPDQAVFAIASPHPRQTFDPFYRGKTIMSTSGMWRQTWDQEERTRKHFVSSIEDPAFKIFKFCAQQHLRRLRDLKELI